MNYSSDEDMRTKKNVAWQLINQILDAVQSDRLVSSSISFNLIPVNGINTVVDYEKGAHTTITFEIRQ